MLKLAVISGFPLLLQRAAFESKQEQNERIVQAPTEEYASMKEEYTGFKDKIQAAEEKAQHVGIVWTAQESGLSHFTLHKKATIHHVTTMLATSKNVLFPGHSHLLTTVLRTIHFKYHPRTIKLSGHQHQWLAGSYDLERDIFRGD